MPTYAEVVPAALLAALFYTAIGWPLAQRVLAPALAPFVAPILGWAVFNTIALPVFTFVPFGRASLLFFAGASLTTSLAALRRGTSMPVWPMALAALCAILPALALMPKHVGDGVLLGPPIFDHVKIAMIDQMVREGLPPGNPFIAAPTPLAYYYLWHFSAAQIAAALGLSGWAGDIAMTWFTGFAALMTMMGLAVAFSGGRVAALLVAVLSLPASLRFPFALLLGEDRSDDLLPEPAELGAWLNQASWAPQHLAAAACVVLALLLILRSVREWRAAAALPLVVAAGFESSSYVGGIAFAAAAAAAGGVLLVRIPAGGRLRFAAHVAAAALATIVLIAPFALRQAAVLAARGIGVPLVVAPYDAFESQIANLLGFWPLLLPFSLPALCLAGPIGWARSFRYADSEGRTTLLVLAAGGLACVCVTWLLQSTIENNDLGWRAFVPALLLLTAFAAAAWTRWLAEGWSAAATLALALALLGLPTQVLKLQENLVGVPSPGAAAFAEAPALWHAVRENSAPGDRVANNPLLASSLTPWPANVSWALLANRPSCYAGWAGVVAFGALTRTQLEATDARFQRVFAGHPEPGDIEALARDHDCTIVAVTRDDSAWSHDPFAVSGIYALVDENLDHWRIYRRTDAGTKE